MIDLTKEVLRLEAEGLSRSQIASRLGMSRGSVSARIHRARNPRPKGERRPRKSPSPAIYKKRTWVCLDDEMFEEVRERAARSGQTISATLRDLVEWGLEA